MIADVIDFPRRAVPRPAEQAPPTPPEHEPFTLEDAAQRTHEWKAVADWWQAEAARERAEATRLAGALETANRALDLTAGMNKGLRRTLALAAVLAALPAFAAGVALGWWGRALAAWLAGGGP